MVENPNVLKRAQEEIDRVVGSERLPTFSDRKNLPYVEAVLKETFRWETIVTTCTFNSMILTDLHQLIVLKLLI